MASRGPVLAIDYGAKRIGMAVSDAEQEFAFPAGVLERTDLAHDLAALCEVARERGAVQLLVGLPVHMDGRRGVEAQAAERFGRALAEAAELPLDLLDERWTSREAERALRAVQPRRRKRERARVDAAAAALLLRTYLERERSAGA